ncbi:site-specific integrase [Sphingomonas rhizophila]|uniref:Site-specific integrase n=1 Tax=Sphingomonas rhizophila TaxID=2071607 RepID=A0A7G9S9K4_9SPHN|nr:site-specific integrase [Sphingomonas rhizophila]QNN64529.1 site-specific integrase [Sphingomonas rhizophila]
MKYNAANERIKREYFRYLAEAKGRDEATIDGIAKALARFEETTGRKDFKRLHREQAIAFKRKLAEASNARTGERLSKATTHSTLRQCRDFFLWLAREPGYKSHIAYADADYFSLSEKDVAVARARREKRVPTIAQVEIVLGAMPDETIVQRRDRALIAFALLTAARVGALASFRLSDVDPEGGYVDQDARHVRTKFAKTFRTYLMPVSISAREIFLDWYGELKGDPARDPSGPLFPATAMALDGNGEFAPAGLERNGWSGSGPIREIFKRAFKGAGLPYFNPHSFRDMLVRHAMTLNLSAEAMKAWSQNLGHADVLTTFTSYGQIPVHRQGELIGRMSPMTNAETFAASVDPALVAQVLAAMQKLPSQVGR